MEEEAGGISVLYNNIVILLYGMASLLSYLFLLRYIYTDTASRLPYAIILCDTRLQFYSSEVRLGP